MDRKLAIGASVNVLGAIAKGLHPLFLILATQLFGAETVGLYLLAAAMLRFLGGLAIAGYKSGVVMFGGRHAGGDEADQATLYGVFANAIVMCVGASLLIIGGTHLFGAPVLEAYNASYADNGLVAALTVLSLSLPFLAVAELAVAATRSLMIMRYDAFIMGFLRPLLLMVFAVVAYVVQPDLVGLAWAHVATHVVLAVAAGIAFARHFVIRRVIAALLRFRVQRELTAFAFPQSLNLALSYFISDVDLIMLGWFGIPQAGLGLYGIAAQVIRSVRQIKLAFSGAFGPLIARLHRVARVDEIVERAGVLSRWMLILAVPAVLLVVGLRNEILLLFSPEFADLTPEDTGFMVALAAIPLLSCAVGLWGNVVVMTGHSRVNLLNSLVVGGLNIALNWVLIPRLGLMGAALGSMLASMAVVTLQAAEVKWLLGVPVSLRPITKPVVAGIAGIAALAAMWLVLDGNGSMAARIVSSMTAVTLYLVVLKSLGLDPRDAAAIRRRTVEE